MSRHANAGSSLRRLLGLAAAAAAAGLAVAGQWRPAFCGTAPEARQVSVVRKARGPTPVTTHQFGHIMPKSTKEWMGFRKGKEWQYLTPNKPDHLGHVEEFNRDICYFGDYGIQSLEQAWFTSRQLEIFRRVIMKATHRQGKLYMRVFPVRAINQRLSETRAGFTRGKFEYWTAVVRKGMVLMELSGVSEDVAYQAFREASYIIPFKLKFLRKEAQPSDFSLDPEEKAEMRGPEWTEDRPTKRRRFPPSVRHYETPRRQDWA